VAGSGAKTIASPSTAPSWSGVGGAALATGPVTAFLLAFVPILVFDFFYYWFHRLQHQWDWLWEIHQLHHSEPALNVTTNFRHHWLEEFFRSFFILLPMNWVLGLGPATSAVAALFIGQWSSFFHANIRLGLGPLTSVITGPQYHRIHHSIEPRHFRRNYAAFFPLWDWVFGTYFRPAKGEWPEVGLEGTSGVLKLPRCCCHRSTAGLAVSRTLPFQRRSRRSIIDGHDAVRIPVAAKVELPNTGRVRTSGSNIPLHIGHHWRFCCVCRVARGAVTRITGRNPRISCSGLVIGAKCM
jgi:hypothetical protein